MVKCFGVDPLSDEFNALVPKKGKNGKIKNQRKCARTRGGIRRKTTRNLTWEETTLKKKPDTQA